jgi:ABC-type branched-subunit amino acid transport system substrate-binding protein
VIGKKLEIVFEDTAGAPDKAASGFERLITRDKVVMVLGESHSSSALAQIEVANRLKVPFVVAEAWADEITAKNYPDGVGLHSFLAKGGETGVSPKAAIPNTTSGTRPF